MEASVRKGTASASVFGTYSEGLHVDLGASG